ncbi:hypothetical protein WJX79_006028 [Trebouxia sp. C0005]
MQHAQPGQGGNETSPMEYVWRAEPIKVHGAVVASYGSENPALGCPMIGEGHIEGQRDSDAKKHQVASG